MTDQFRDIRRALEKRLADIQDTSLLPAIAFENVNFDPTGRSEWLRSRIVYIESRPSALGPDAMIRYYGVMFVDCFVRADQGTLSADDLAQDVMDLFPYSKLLTEAGRTVRIRFSERSGGLYDAPWYQVPVTITWYSYI